MIRYKHDCTECKSLGEFENYDLYYCAKSILPTIVCRYGNLGQEYLSGLIFGLDSSQKGYRVALMRALMISEYRKQILDEFSKDINRLLRLKDMIKTLDLIKAV